MTDERKQIISSFMEMTVDMDYILCVPAVHARYLDKEIVIDYSGEIKSKSEGFPEERIELLKKWIGLHRDEIERNHHKCGCSDYPLTSIPPLSRGLCERVFGKRSL